MRGPVTEGQHHASTCTRHQPGELCYNQHHCRCQSCRDAHSYRDWKTKGQVASPSDTIPVTETTRALAARLIASHDADDLTAMLGLDLIAEPPSLESVTSDGPRVLRNRGLVHGERVA